MNKLFYLLLIFAQVVFCNLETTNDTISKIGQNQRFEQPVTTKSKLISFEPGISLGFPMLLGLHVGLNVFQHIGLEGYFGSSLYLNSSNLMVTALHSFETIRVKAGFGITNTSAGGSHGGGENEGYVGILNFSLLQNKIKPTWFFELGYQNEKEIVNRLTGIPSSKRRVLTRINIGKYFSINNN